MCLSANILVFGLSHMILAIGLATAQTCYNTGNFTTTSAYARNLDLILSSLPVNVSKNGGFFTTSIGQDRDKVYALGLCRGDTSIEICSNRISAAVQDILANCSNKKEAISWGPGNPPCIVRYTNRSVFGILELDPTKSGCNQNHITFNLTQFDQFWVNLTDSLVRKASKGSTRLKFATEETDFNGLQRIYSLMQCTPDLSQSDCANCLRVAADENRKGCYGRQGGYVDKPNCFFRWGFYPFYDSTVDTSSQSTLPNAPPARSVDTKRRQDEGRTASRIAIYTVVPIVIFMAMMTLTCTLLQRMRKKDRNENVRTMPTGVSRKSLQLDFTTIKSATTYFSADNKLGQGGFGIVYKGILPNGQAVAVKRLSRNTEQGEVEFKNEVLLMAELQHRNLVKFIGFCLDDDERLLVYEYLVGSSLDNFIFHPTKRVLLNWEHRYKIIIGIARGLNYLHQDSRLRIIHRDLKAGNILLDAEMNPKISDFGMAKLFKYDQTHNDTRRVVGTFGYMAPEYVTHGRFSMKSDVYSFGVLALEILTGKKISHFSSEDEESLPTYAWENWKKGTPLNVIDPILISGSKSEILKCLHLGLLCVQHDIADRPTMASVVLTLGRSTYFLPEPLRPGFYLKSSLAESSLQNNKDNRLASDNSRTENIRFTSNEVSISDIVPR